MIPGGAAPTSRGPARFSAGSRGSSWRRAWCGPSSIFGRPSEMELRDHIRTIPDFPVPGIRFRDITPLIGNAGALTESVRLMTRHWTDRRVEMVAAMEARGFIFGAAMAVELGAGFVPVRKTGKLPYRARSVEYQLEYRNDVPHIHEV